MASSGSLADLEELVTCPLCIENFDLKERVPKVLDCGHTNCLECLNKHVRKSGSRNCPQCRQQFAEAPYFIKNNFHICQVLESCSGPKTAPACPVYPELPQTSAPSAVGMRFFCQRCDSDATDICLMTNHPVCDKTSMVLKRIQEAKQQAQAQFEREAAMLKDLTDTLDDIKAAVTNKGGLTSRVHRELDALKGQKQGLDKTTQLIEKVQTSTFQDNDDLPNALERFLQNNSARLFALDEQKRMLDMAKTCSVTVTSEEAGLAWSAKIAVGEKSPAEERVFSYLVFLLLLNQQQRQMEDSPPDTPADGSEAGVGCLDPSAPNLAGAGDGVRTERSSWAAGSVTTASLDELLDQVKQCVIDGHGPDDESEDSDDDDDSDTWSVVSDVSSVGVPDNCQGAKKVFVGKIPPTAKPEEIKGLFAKFGRILYVRFLNSQPKAKSLIGKVKVPKHICALVFVPDDTTVENILRNRPIVFQRTGQFERFLLNVQEDRSQKRQAKVEARRQRRVQRGKKGAQSSTTASSTQNAVEVAEALRRIFVNQVPLDVGEEKLKIFFSTYGDVESVIKRRHGTGNKCMAFVTFKDQKSVKHILEAEKRKPISYQGEGYPNGFALQVREFRCSATPAPVAAPVQAAPQSQPGSTWTDTVNTAVAATTVALSAYCVSTMEKQRNETALLAAQLSRQGQPNMNFQNRPQKQFTQPAPQPLLQPRPPQNLKQQVPMHTPCQPKQQQQPRQQQQQPQRNQHQQQKPQQQPQRNQHQQQKPQQQKGPPKSKSMDDKDQCCIM